MNINELRVKNVILRISKGIQEEIEVDSNLLKFLLSKPTDNYKPIKLDENILFDYGAEKKLGTSKDLEFYFTENFFLFQEKTFKKEAYYIVINETRFYIDYLHRLQNIFFFLEGKDLEKC